MGFNWDLIESVKVMFDFTKFDTILGQLRLPDSGPIHPILLRLTTG